MKETELEQVIKDVFSDCGLQCDGREYNILNHTVGNKSLWVPWWCASAEEMNSFLVERTFLLRPVLQTKRIALQYVVTVLFGAMAKHDSSCGSNIQGCNHTDFIVRDYFCKPLEEQKKILDDLIDDGFYIDALHFCDNTVKKGNNKLVYSIESNPPLIINEKGMLEVSSVPKYKHRNYELLKLIPRDYRLLFTKLDYEINKDLERGKFCENQVMPALIKQITKLKATG